MSSFVAFVRVAALSLPLFAAGASSATAAPSQGTPASAETKAGKGKKAKGKKKGKKHAKAGKHMRGLCAQLRCTETQTEQITTRLQALREQQQDARKGQAALQTALSRELAKEKPSKKELARIQKDLARMQTKATESTLDALLDIHAVLDAEQRKTLATLVERNGLRRLLRGGGHHPRPVAAAQQLDTPPSAPPL